MSDHSGAGVVLRHDHEGGDIPDYHEAIWLGDHTIRDRRGRPHKHGYTRFAVVICNNPGCKYEALVDAEVIASTALSGSVTPPGDDGLPTQEAEDHGTVAQ